MENLELLKLRLQDKIGQEIDLFTKMDMPKQGKFYLLERKALKSNIRLITEF